jgi:hypothetical protein
MEVFAEIFKIFVDKSKLLWINTCIIILEQSRVGIKKCASQSEGKEKKVMKKIVFFAAMVAALFSCSDMIVDGAERASLEAASRNINTEMVQVLTIEDIERAHYGIPERTVTFKVRIKNLAFDKNIVVYGELEDGTWEDLSTGASYVGPAGEGYEIWKVTAHWISYYGDTPFGDEFVVRYEVAGNTYWDNNGGNNYVSEGHSGLQFTAAAGNIQLYTAYGYSYNNSVGMSVNLRNLSPNKTVKVVYSWDNWNTVNEAYFSYASMIYPSYASVLYSPNSHGIERWTADFMLPAGVSFEDVKFALSYETDGQTYWDNNYGYDYQGTTF